MRNSRRWKLIVSTAVLCSPALGAQNPIYNPSIVDLSDAYKPPQNVTPLICSPTAYPDVEQRSLCKDGVAASRQIAETYAQPAGAYLGCLDGMHQGLRYGFEAGQADPNGEYMRAAQAEYANVTFVHALAAAAKDAAAVGQTASADEIIASYRAVIGKRNAAGRPELPVKAPKVLKFDPKEIEKNYQGGYESDVASQDPTMNEAYATNWVSANSVWDDRIQARSLYTAVGPYENSLCKDEHSLFQMKTATMERIPGLSIWDIFQRRQRIAFEQYGWTNAEWAWQVLMTYERGMAEYASFAEIDHKTKLVTVKENVTQRQVKRVNGVPQTDPATGDFIYEDVVVGTRDVQKQVDLSPEEKQALRNAMKKGFIDSYNLAHARQYASINFRKSANSSFDIGMTIGRLMGADVARQNARKAVYDAGYKTAAVGEYMRLVKENYNNSFNALIRIFETNPVMELNKAVILGTTPDGIFRAGEGLGVQFSATNLGEVSRPSVFSIVKSASVIPAEKGYAFSIPALSRADFTSTVLGTVADGVRAQTRLPITIGLQNPGNLNEVAKSLRVEEGQEILINDYLEISRINTELNLLAGVATSTIDLINPANGTAPLIASKVDLNLGGADVAQSNVLQIAGGGVSQIKISVKSLDPLRVINAGGVVGSANTYVADKIAHTVPAQASITGDAIHGNAYWSGILNYFDALAADKASSGTQSKVDRMATLISIIRNQVKSEVDGNNIKWFAKHNNARENQDLQNTILAAVGRAYARANSGGARVSASAQAAYNELGRQLAPFRENVKAAGGLNRGQHKDAYTAMVKAFAKI